MVLIAEQRFRLLNNVKIASPSLSNPHAGFYALIEEGNRGKLQSNATSVHRHIRCIGVINIMLIKYY
jgi:hypothetical protein